MASRRDRHSNVSRKNSPGRKRKQHFRGNRFTKKEETNKQNEPPRSVKKIRLSDSSEQSQSRVSSEADLPKGYRIVHWDLLEQFSRIVKCSECGGEISVEEKSIRGLGFSLVVKCSGCESSTELNSCPMIGKQKNAMEVNTRSVAAMRMIGQGLSGLETFCWVMDLPPPVSQTSHDRIVNHIAAASSVVCEESVSRAAKEEIEKTGDTGLHVSGDGSWRKPGFSSLQGVAHVIGYKTGKVLDHEMKSKYCKECVLWEKKCGTQEYSDWLEDHEGSCDLNYEGSSGGMEVAAITDIFRRSQEKHGVKYLYYIGDGDSKTYKAVCDDNPYPGETIRKKECVGHVQKRFGTRVRNLLQTYKGRKLIDKKGLTGKGRLTGKVIDQLQIYYGNAIRANASSVSAMKNAVMATFFHYSSTDVKPQHHLCPVGEDSWCKWQLAKARKEKMRNFKHASKLPAVCMQALVPVYKSLSDEELLERCLGGFTQNSNESLNNIIWKLLPKKSFSGSTVLNMGANIAVSMFNDGHNAALDLLEELGVQVGVNAVNGALNADPRRMSAAERKSLMTTLEARRSQRQARLKAAAEAEDSVDALYSAGAY